MPRTDRGQRLVGGIGVITLVVGLLLTGATTGGGRGADRPHQNQALGTIALLPAEYVDGAKLERAEHLFRVAQGRWGSTRTQTLREPIK